MPQNAAVGAVYNPKGIPYTIAAASLQDWVLVQQNATGRVGKMRLSVLLGATLLSAEDAGAAGPSGEVTLNAGSGVVKSIELTSATTYTLTLKNDHITTDSTVDFEVTENPDEGTPEITGVLVGDGDVSVTVAMEPFTGVLTFNFTVS